MKLSRIFFAAMFVASTAAAEDPPKVGFEEAVKESIKNNPQTQKSVEQIRRAEALLRQARATSFPTLTAVGNYIRLDADRTRCLAVACPPAMLAVLGPANSLNAQIVASVPLIAAQQWVKWLHAGDQIDVAKTSAADMTRTIAVSTARAYLTVVAQHRVVESSSHARGTAKAHLEFAQGRLNAGIGNKIDEVRAAQQFAQAEFLLQNANIGLARSQEALGVLVGRDGPLDTGQEPALGDVDGSALAGVDARTDVVAAMERWQAARHVQRDGWTDFLPTLTGNFAPFYQEPPSLIVPQTGWQAQLLLTIPLYDGGFRYGAQRERASLNEQARLDYEGILRQARSEVRTAATSVRFANDALKAARDYAQLADQALELATTAYRAGATTSLELTDAQRAARDAATQVAEAEDVARQARLDLLAAAGRFP
jgi:outer membrane protein TolC